MSRAPSPASASAPGVYHEGELRVQRLAGVADRAARVAKVYRSDIPDTAAAFVARQPWIVLGAADEAGRVWATILEGEPGFALARNSRTLELRATPGRGDPLAGAVTPGREVGILAIELASRRRMRVNGRLVDSDDRKGAEGSILLSTDQVYSNCPKYIQAREVALPPVLPVRPEPEAERLSSLDPSSRTAIEGADTFFIASLAPGFGADASHRGGRAGFVRVDGDRLAWPDYVGNAMFNTLGNIAVHPNAGLLFVDFAAGDLLHLTGTASLDASSSRAGEWEGAERVVDFRVEEGVRRPGALAIRFGEPDPSPFLP